MNARGTGHLYQRGNTWWIKFYEEGRARYESCKTDNKTKAQRILNDRLASVQTGSYAPGEVLMSTLLNEMLQHHRLHHPKSYETFARYLTELHLAPYFGRHRAKQVTTAKLIAYIEHERKRGASDGTINRELSLLHKAFRLATESTPRKVAIVPKFPWLRENNARQGFLEPEGYERLKAVIKPELFPALVVAYHIGCRKKELLSIRPEWVDLAAGVIRLPGSTTKNSKPRTVPIYGEMVPVLTKLMADLKENWPMCPRIFHRDGVPIKHFRTSWLKACAAAGFPKLLFHDLRRSAVRNMRKAGISESTAMRISGHLTRRIFERYDIVNEEDLREAGDQLAEFLGAKTKAAGGSK